MPLLPLDPGVIPSDDDALPDSRGYLRTMARDGLAWARAAVPPGDLPQYVSRRPLRVLHIGNIANNAYHNARILNRAGLDCDVLCYNYFHVMGSPEWEESDFAGGIANPDRPDWDAVDLKGYVRPRWFAQGLLRNCLHYLEARRSGRQLEAAFSWRLLPGNEIAPGCVSESRQAAEGPEDTAHFGSLVDDFARVYPERRDPLTLDDVRHWLRTYGGLPGAELARLRALFSSYDIVHGYGVDPVWPLLTRTRPYLAFEHGTIRSFPFDDGWMNRLTALAYHHADATVITNCDNRTGAERLQLARYCFIPHAVNETWIANGGGSELRAQLRAELAADFLVFHPSRHHWDEQRDPSLEKGNDIFIRGFAELVRQVAPRAAAVFVEWGQHVERSRALVAELGITSRVKWVGLQHNCSMSRFIDASDVVADQFYLGAFGNIMPKALALGRPAILYLDEDAHDWSFSELPPVINARTPAEVLSGLTRAYRDLAWRRDLEARGERWYRRHHSNAVICERLLALYKGVLAQRSPPHEAREDQLDWSGCADE